jgi:hypothetical protein
MLCVALLAGVVLLPRLSRHGQLGELPVVHASAPSACSFPTQPASSPEQTVWEMFTAANCPWKAGNGAMQVVWESWPTQEEVYTSQTLTATHNGAKSRFHVSLLQQALTSPPTANGLLLNPDTECTKAAAAPHRTICEEVRLNPAAVKYVRQNGLTTHVGQGKFVGASKTVDFPSDAVEVKADWLPNCKDPSLHVETIAGTPYCLIAMHVLSKLVPTWDWGTWEAKNDTATPNRCVTLGCNDPFGSVPAQIPAGPMARIERDHAMQSASLKQLQQSAGLTAEWASYALDGAQANYVNADGSPVLEGNSITEEEIVGQNLKTSSCMTCHAYSGVNTAGADSIKSLRPVVGKPVALPAGYQPRDFVWSLAKAQ